MSLHKKRVSQDPITPEEKAPRLVAEDAEESRQGIEEAAYYIGLNRQRDSKPGNELNDWFEAERAVKEDLE